jgi:hypothetical protein
MCKIINDNEANNFFILRRIAFNYLKNESSTKIGIIDKRNKVGWSILLIEDNN